MNRNQGYNGNIRLKSAGVSIDWTEHQIVEWIKCKEDPIYFIRTYIKIVTVDHGLRPMITYKFQEEFADAILNKSNRVIGLCARQMGKCVQGSTLINIAIKDNNGDKNYYDDIPIELVSAYAAARKSGAELPDIESFKRKKQKD